jgi:hypothetical protein
MFGPQEEDNYILNKATGQKMMLKARGRGSYVMEVQFVGGEKTTWWIVGRRRVYVHGSGERDCLGLSTRKNICSSRMQVGETLSIGG